MRFWLGKAHPGEIYEQSKRILAKAGAPDEVGDTTGDAAHLPCLDQEQDTDMAERPGDVGSADVGLSDEDSCLPR